LTISELRKWPPLGCPNKYLRDVDWRIKAETNGPNGHLAKSSSEEDTKVGEKRPDIDRGKKRRLNLVEVCQRRPQISEKRVQARRKGWGQMAKCFLLKRSIRKQKNRKKKGGRGGKVSTHTEGRRPGKSEEKRGSR